MQPFRRVDGGPWRSGNQTRTSIRRPSTRWWVGAVLAPLVLVGCAGSPPDPSDAAIGSSAGSTSPAVVVPSLSNVPADPVVPQSPSGSVVAAVPSDQPITSAAPAAPTVQPTLGPDRFVADPSPTSVANPPCPGQRCVTLALSGDVLLHPQLIEQAREDAAESTDSGSGSAVDGMDFFPILAAQQPFVAGADIGICHLETPLADPAGPFENYPAFSVPPQVLPALVRTGYDACTTASNHTLDQGTDGITRTLDDLDGAGLLHDGSYRSPADARTPVVINTHSGRVGLISVAYGFNGYEPDEPWQVNTIDVDAIKAKARAARQAGADLVIVAMHAGEEYQSTPNAQQKEAAKTLLADPDIDLVYGHHAHVVQTMEKINGKWAIYGLGNNIAAQLGSAPGVQEGLLVRVQFSQDAAGSWTTSDVAWVASHQDVGPPYRWCALGAGADCGTGDAGALDRTTAVVNQWGADADGARRIG